MESPKKLSICPDKWGGDLWKLLHFITTQYEPRKKKEFRRFFTEIVGSILPCNKCSVNYKYHLKKNPIRLESKEELMLWLFEIHNMTNTLLKKKKLTKTQFKSINWVKKDILRSFEGYTLLIQMELRGSDDVLFQIAFSQFLSFIMNHI